MIILGIIFAAPGFRYYIINLFKLHALRLNLRAFQTYYILGTLTVHILALAICKLIILTGIATVLHLLTRTTR